MADAHFGADDALDADEFLVDDLKGALPHLGGEVFPACNAHTVCIRVVFLVRTRGRRAFYGEGKVTSRNIEPRDAPRVEIRHVALVFRDVDSAREDGCRRRSEPWRRLGENTEQLTLAAANIENLIKF